MIPVYRTLLKKLAELLPEDVSPDILAHGITESDAAYLDDHWQALSDVELMWQAMDSEWDRLGAGYRPGEAENLGKFYGSPVWLLNGIFTAIDPESMRHREILADYIAGKAPGTIAEFGGGFGSLSRNLAMLCPNSTINVVEPFATKLALTLSAKLPNLNYCDQLPVASDIVIAQDVLEHVTDPLGQFAKLLDAVPVGGLVITANCFKSVIKCHYPGAYHFDHSFKYIAPQLGCRLEECLPGAEHIEVYRKTREHRTLLPARILEQASKMAEPAAKFLVRLKS